MFRDLNIKDAILTMSTKAAAEVKRSITMTPIIGLRRANLIDQWRNVIRGIVHCDLQRFAI
jgi:hypothetical protein